MENQSTAELIHMLILEEEKKNPIFRNEVTIAAIKIELNKRLSKCSDGDCKCYKK